MRNFWMIPVHACSKWGMDPSPVHICVQGPLWCPDAVITFAKSSHMLYFHTVKLKHRVEQLNHVRPALLAAPYMWLYI